MLSPPSSGHRKGRFAPFALPLMSNVRPHMPPFSVTVRPAEVADAATMLEIYRPYVEASAISFEQEVPSVEEYAARVRKYLSGWAGVVAEVDGKILGYAYGSAHRERAAYKWSVETTVYVAQSAQRQGVGRRLYARFAATTRSGRLLQCLCRSGSAKPGKR